MNPDLKTAIKKCFGHETMTEALFLLPISFWDRHTCHFSSYRVTPVDSAQLYCIMYSP